MRGEKTETILIKSVPQGTENSKNPCRKRFKEKEGRSPGSVLGKRKRTSRMMCVKAETLFKKLKSSRAVKGGQTFAVYAREVMKNTPETGCQTSLKKKK